MVPSVTGKKTAHNLPEAERRDPPPQKVMEKVVGSGEKNLTVRDEEVHRTTRLWRSTTMVRKLKTSHMKVPPGYVVLECGAGKSLCGAKPVALMAQTEAIDESYHFRGIGNQIVSSFMKLRVPGSIDGKDVSFAPSVTPGGIPPLVGNDHLNPWGCSIHLCPDECRLEIPSRGIDAKLLVTASNHILVNLADLEGMEEPDYDVWTSKRGRDSEETGTESDMTEGTEETITDPKEVPAKRSRRGVPRKTPRVPRKKPPPACIQLSPALQSELRKIAACSCKRLIGWTWLTCPLLCNDRYRGGLTVLLRWRPVPRGRGSSGGGRLQGFLPGQSYSLSSEQIVDNPVPCGRGDNGGLQGFLQGQNPSAVVEQSVDIPVPGGAFHDLHPDPGSPASSAASRDEACKGFFRTFPRSQKSAEVAGQVGENLRGLAACEAHHVIRDDL